LKTIVDLGEYELLRLLNEWLPSEGKGIVVPSGDDAAVVSPPSGDTVITTDTIVGGIHFRVDWATPEEIGRKLVVMNLSDIASMGALSDYAVIAASFPCKTEVKWVKALYEGMLCAAEEAGVSILGGDTTESPTLTLTMTMFGHVPEGEALTFSGAKVGDGIYVTGTLGGSRAGLEVLSRKGRNEVTPEEEACIRKHLSPACRWKEASKIARELKPSAMTDISDGLDRDIYKMCDSSGVGFEINVESIPLNSHAANVANSLGARVLDWAISSGEEFELLFTLPEEKSVESLSEELDCPISRIGIIVEKGNRWITSDGKDFTPSGKGYEHFK